MPDFTHLSLFSGIGGLDLAAEWAGFRGWDAELVPGLLWRRKFDGIWRIV